MVDNLRSVLTRPGFAEAEIKVAFLPHQNAEAEPTRLLETGGGWQPGGELLRRLEAAPQMRREVRRVVPEQVKAEPRHHDDDLPRSLSAVEGQNVVSPCSPRREGDVSP